MSLLLDALRRAEQEKLAKQTERPSASERERPPSHAASGAQSGLELQPVSATAAAAAAANAPAMPGRSDTESAKNLFAAKSAAAAEPARRGGVLWVALGVIVIVITAVGAYVWYSIEALSPKAVARAPRPAPLAPPTTKPADFSIGPRLDTPPAAPTPAPASASAPVTAVLTPLAPSASAPESEPPRRAAPQTADQMMMSLLKEAPAAPPLRLSQTSDTPRVPADVAVGYEALRSGNLGAARRGYTAALASDPSNLDAQLGLATVEARSGSYTQAANLYRRVLDLDPRNATALAGLASLTDFSRPEAIESQLRGDVARYPQSAALRFTLGNLYASQSRWSEAQLEYFEAYRLDPASADITFNLAVSLDHLRQPRVASEYYRRALAAARTQAVQFDPAPVERRLAELGFEPPAAGR
jgi:cytochrome c-type biogenesis protein CcmH/NrfG